MFPGLWRYVTRISLPLAILEQTLATQPAHELGNSLAHAQESLYGGDGVSGFAKSALRLVTEHKPNSAASRRGRRSGIDFSLASTSCVPVGVEDLGREGSAVSADSESPSGPRVMSSGKIQAGEFISTGEIDECESVSLSSFARCQQRVHGMLARFHNIPESTQADVDDESC